MRAPIACGAAALALGLLSTLSSLGAAGWDVTALPRVDAQKPLGGLAREIDPGFHTISPGAYDGQWYWGIAVDPLATGRAHADFDHPAYRYSHPFFGWLGWLLSAGQNGAAATVLLVVGLLSLGGAAVVAGLLGRTGWEGLAIALNPGLVYSASHELTEPLSALLLAGALLAHARGRRAATVVLLALLVLSKEPFVLVPPALALWEVLRRRERPARAATLLLAVLPAAAWWLWVRVHLGAWLTAGPVNLLVWPGQGWYKAFVLAARHTYDVDPTQNQFGEATLVVLVVLVGILLVAVVPALRLRTPAAAAYLPLVALLSCLGPGGTIYERDILRAAAVTLVLVPFLGTGLRRRGSE
jgi:hypothetical protein